MFMTLSTIKIGLDPVLIHIGSLSVHWYGLMYVAGLMAGMWVAVPYGERLGISRDTAYELFWPILIGCLVGGRLYYVVQSNLGWYLQHPQNIIATWEGGMAFYGAIFLGLPVAYVAGRIKRVPFATLLDAVTPLIPVAQSFGRVGNLINGDILGYPSSLPWATQYTNPHNTFVPSHAVAYDPAAAYELIFTVALFAVLWRLRFAFRVPGTLFALWAVLYSAGQFALFFTRANTVVMFDLKQAQLTAIVVVLVTVPLWMAWRRWYLDRVAPPRVADPPLERETALVSETAPRPEANTHP